MDARLQTKRLYDDVGPHDGIRILVDGLWPRGIAKADAPFEKWHRDLAPSAQLRKWFAHDPERWQAFERRYREELATRNEAVLAFLEHLTGSVVTLVYAARDPTRNNAVVLAAYLQEKLEAQS